VQATTWQAFWRTAVLNESVEEVAEDLKMTPGAIYVARSRMIVRIRKTIESADVSEQRISQVLPSEGVQ